MQLSKRLSAVADMVTSGSRLADVGTDHAYIPIYLIESKRIPKAIAMDIGQGPLKRAAENISRHGLTEQIETRLSNGVEELLPGQAESIVIAGMGGMLMMHILEAGEDIFQGMTEMILQPQSDIDRVRRFLQENGYCIVAENMIYEDDKFYPMMRVIPGRMPTLTDEEYEYGPCLLADKHPCLRQFLAREEGVYERLLEILEIAGTKRTQVRLAEVEAKLKKIQKAKEMCQ